MAIARTHSSKSPTQAPEKFYALDQQGGAYGKPTKVPQELPSGPLVEPIMGRKTLHEQSTNK